MIPLLLRDEPFPPVAQALREPNGLLCAGADLSVARLLAAYQRGIFPWYSAGEPLLWWSPDPRMVLFPDEFKISRSLARTLRNAHYEVRLDTQFAQVMSECAAPRRQQAGTWISREMQTAYTQLHELGHAHSVEVWIDDKLAGGLYGVALGRVFYGESMFSHQRDTSKIALAHLCRFLEQQGFVMIDCQMKTAHLASLGAREISRSQFLARLAEAVSGNSLADSGRWPQAAAQPLYRQTGHFLTT